MLTVGQASTTAPIGRKLADFPVPVHGAGLSGQDRARADRDYYQGVRLATYVGMWTWPAFTLLDVYMALVLYPDAATWHYLSLRIAGEVWLLAGYFFIIRADKLRRTQLFQETSFIPISCFIALLAVDFGGLNSVYVHGTTVAMLVQTTLVISPWTKRRWILGPMALSFPVVMGVVAPFVPEIAAQWADPSAVLAFLSNYVFVLSSGVLGALGGHIVWATRQQVYEARRLGSYRLKALIGEGGMGEIWLATKVNDSQNVALKILRAQHTGEVSVKRFAREALAASRLSSPHTIRIFDYGASRDGLYYIAMELLQGADLGEVVRLHGPLPAARAVHVARQACESLDEAHRSGIVHRDIKPENLFVLRHGRHHDFTKLLDFGIAQFAAGNTEASLTRTGMVPGTPAFMAPEVHAGARADARSDIYAIGATLFYLLTGSAPVPAFINITTGLHRASSRDGSNPSVELVAIVRKCLAPRPEDRFQAAAELEQALARVMDADPWCEADAEKFWQQHAALLGIFEAATR